MTATTTILDQRALYRHLLPLTYMLFVSKAKQQVMKSRPNLFPCIFTQPASWWFLVLGYNGIFTPFTSSPGFWIVWNWDFLPCDDDEEDDDDDNEDDNKDGNNGKENHNRDNNNKEDPKKDNHNKEDHSKDDHNKEYF